MGNSKDIEPVLNEHKTRLMEAMAACVAARGYADTTIADIAAEARVSKRTFYEHFDSKPDCLVALYESASEQALSVLRATVDPQRDWHVQVEQAVGAYLGALACNPLLLRTLFIEILALGTRGLRARRRTHQALADFIVAVVNGSTGEAPSPGLGDATATALVGAIHEWVLQAIENDRVPELQTLTAPASRLIRAVIDAHL
ncbi:TetR/AcrR family transcriptional regulator [Caldimonas brevitalea]|uniref:TetR family transcriptional regulator n=1 Tax=Caldimonas brevitalea TaxID=413882 RepID=A0A0G3BPL8_9BURK|nr:TetR/AcrR family transcriptional regulator [Caldimonas brevitalea]AKJ29281.1 TetR family transcriptional regulator [Caldimonas brevitalea]